MSNEVVPVRDSGIAGVAGLTLDGEHGEYVGGGRQLTLNRIDATISAVGPNPYFPGPLGTVTLNATTISWLPVTTTACRRPWPPQPDKLWPSGPTQSTFRGHGQPTGTRQRGRQENLRHRPECLDDSTVGWTVHSREIAVDSDGKLIRFAADAVLRLPGGRACSTQASRAGSSVGYSAVTVQPVPGDLNFGLQLIGTTSTAHPIIVTNSGAPAADHRRIDNRRFPGRLPDLELQHDAAGGVGIVVHDNRRLRSRHVEDRQATLVVSDGTARGSHIFGLDGHGASVPWLTYPYDGQNDVYTSHPFTWLTLPGTQANILIVGTTDNKADLVNTGVLPGNQTSFKVSALPTNVGLHATVFSQINGHWQHSPPVKIDSHPNRQVQPPDQRLVRL